MDSTAQNLMKRDNLILRRLLDAALARQSALALRLFRTEAGEEAVLPPDALLCRPAEVTRNFGGDLARENEALHRALSATQFKVHRTAESLRLAERRAAGLGAVDGVNKPSLPLRLWRAAGMLYYESLSLVGPMARLVQRANRARDARDFAEAARLYAQACDAMPGHFRLWVQQGNMAKDAGLFQQARAAYDRACALQGNNADLHVQIGHMCKMMGDLAGAGHAYSVALSCAPEHQDAYRELEALGYADSAKRIRMNGRP